MNFRKIISLFAFALIVGSFYQCGDNATASSTNSATAEAKTVSNPVTPNSGNVNITGGSISGKLNNAANLQIFIDQSSLSNSNRVIGKSEIDGDGNFTVSIPEGLNAGIYRFRVGAQKNYLIFEGKEKNVNITGDLNAINTFGVTITGSEATAEYYKIMQGFVSKRPSSEEAKSKLMLAKSPLVSAWGAHMVFPAAAGLQAMQDKLGIQKAALNRVKSQYPNAAFTIEMEKTIQTEDAQVAAQLATQKIRIGETAPDIKLQSPEGKTYSLSDLKGKVVLLDFWASWCGPCRRENPNVVAKYKQYKNKGFEVFSVSLDGIHPRVKPRLKTQADIDQQMNAAKGKWEAAIKKDNLIWDYHVSDLQHWGSPAAKKYGVSSIPKTFLIDRDGKIAAINPRGPQLEPALKKLL